MWHVQVHGFNEQLLQRPTFTQAAPPRLLIVPGAEPPGLVANREMNELSFILVFYLILISTEEDQPGHQVSALTSTTSATALKPIPSWMMTMSLSEASSCIIMHLSSCSERTILITSFADGHTAFVACAQGSGVCLETGK